MYHLYHFLGVCSLSDFSYHELYFPVFVLFCFHVRSVFTDDRHEFYLVGARYIFIAINNELCSVLCYLKHLDSVKAYLNLLGDQSCL